MNACLVCKDMTDDHQLVQKGFVEATFQEAEDPGTSHCPGCDNQLGEGLFYEETELCCNLIITADTFLERMHDTGIFAAGSEITTAEHFERYNKDKEVCNSKGLLVYTVLAADGDYVFLVDEDETLHYLYFLENSDDLSN